MTKIKTTDVHISMAEARERGLLQLVEKKTPYHNYKFWVRSDDEVKFNIKQNITDSPSAGEYFTPLLRSEWHPEGRVFDITQLDKEDVWLDAGGHIGIFATRLLTQFKNIKKVIQYEPFANNCEFAILNSQENGVADRTQVIQKALVPGSQESIDFYLAWDSGKHSVLPIRGREVTTVQCQNFNEALKGVTAIKMDVEGAEYDLIKSVEDWSNIRIALIEYHFHYRNLSDGREAKFNEIIDIFRANFDDVWVYPGVEGTKTWITHFAAVKRG
jgi:FkbM family methyltransferase